MPELVGRYSVPPPHRTEGLFPRRDTVRLLRILTQPEPEDAVRMLFSEKGEEDE